MTTEEFIQQAKQKHGDKYDYSESKYVNARTKLRIICREHGVFLQTPDKHINEGCGCPCCAGNLRGSVETFREKAVRIHGAKYDYTAVVYVNNRIPVDIICPIHGVFSQLPSNHLAGKGCPKCANNVMLTRDEFIDRAIAVHGDTYDYADVVYVGNRIPVIIVCKKHGPFEQVPYVHLTGCGCPICGELSRRENRDAVAAHESARMTCLKKYGVDNPMRLQSIRDKQLAAVRSESCNDKRNATKRANGSFNTSLCEHRLFVRLENVFGACQVLRNYKSDVYPFNCDFYVPSRDMYIELNAHWSHGGHWYSESDRLTVEAWQRKSKYSCNAAETFSVRDVVKRKVAAQAMLNYIVFWKADLSDAEPWFAKGCPDGHDWLKEYSWL